MVQLSKCENVFNSSCVIGQSYQWNNGINTESSCNIVWKLDKKNPMIYFRATAQVAFIQVSFEISHTSNKPLTNYVYQGYYPFTGTIINNLTPESMFQYWRTNQITTLKYEDIQYYSLNYCPQPSKIIKGINVAITASPNLTTSLMSQGGCPTNIPFSSCQYGYSYQNNWININELPFNLFSYLQSQTLTLQYGLWSWVKAHGGDSNGINQFLFYANTIYQ